MKACYFVFDINFVIAGVLWTLHGGIIEVQFALRALRNSGKRVSYVSNNSVKDYRAKLEGLADHAVTDDDITYPAKTIVWYLREIKFDALCYNIGSANFKDCLRQAGFQILDGVSHVAFFLQTVGMLTFSFVRLFFFCMNDACFLMYRGAGGSRMN